MKIKSLVLVAVILLFTMVLGCQTSADNKPLNPNNNQTQDNRNEGAQVNNDRNQQAEAFEKTAEQVPGVRNATVFISDPNNLSTDEVNIINTRDGQTPGMVGNTRVNKNNLGNNNMNNNNMDNNNMNNNNMDNNNTRNANQNMIVMVGLELDQNRDMNNDSRNIENMVSQRIKNSDSRIYQVIVTADAGIVKQITNLTNRAGRATNTGIRDITPGM